MMTFVLQLNNVIILALQQQLQLQQLQRQLRQLQPLLQQLQPQSQQLQRQLEQQPRTKRLPPKMDLNAKILPMTIGVGTIPVTTITVGILPFVIIVRRVAIFVKEH